MVWGIRTEMSRPLLKNIVECFELCWQFVAILLHLQYITALLWGTGCEWNESCRLKANVLQVFDILQGLKKKLSLSAYDLLPSLGIILWCCKYSNLNVSYENKTCKLIWSIPSIYSRAQLCSEKCTPFLYSVVKGGACSQTKMQCKFNCTACQYV